MAELALAIAGIALTWKNILDFGKVIMDLLADDDWERRGLCGTFHKFELQRKEFILQVIFRLHDSRVRAFKILRERYALSGVDDEEYQGPDLSRKAKGFARMIDKAKSVSRKTKDKGMWLSHDQRAVKELIDDADEQYRHLKELTFESIPFILNVIGSQGKNHDVQENLAVLQTRAKQENQKELAHLRKTSSPRGGEESSESDRATAVGYATQSIASCNQAERVRELVNEGYALFVDTRIIEGVHDWWLDEGSGSLVLETPYSVGDNTSAVACAAVYYLASCHKIIYVLDLDDKKPSSVQLAEMVGTVTMMLTYLAGESIDARDLPLLDGITGSMTADHGDLQLAVGAFEKLIGQFLAGTDQRFLIIIDGLDDLVDRNTDEPVLAAIRSLLQSLARICGRRAAKQPVVKILLGCKGAATVISEYVSDTEILTVMDRPQRKENVMEGLAERW
ncbi:uncharacterized protein A1O9_09477 [Exophiala aquamarina CBS 119918]|uniref:Prion-inhibition and propagation HeLo domain-containing protein n=1 Tax=Exophiala aquamarina CBS 119918 TaxID=1182545 RepID=A0A072P3C1_9EURO|nr:uncharacterized protein A1O9_09477 [Exophiala aquamarina CBS 119918]KEF54311.1 hypothetical protein A1O9_09477 [Exophiala aquamarina CBS 119918]